MKTIVYWLIFVVIFAAGIADELHGPKLLGLVAISFVLLVVPTWVVASAWLVKRAVDNAQKSNFKEVRFLLISRSWLIFPSFKYNDIVRLLRELSLHPDKKPTFNSPEFSKYIISDGMGYILTWDGKEKMLEKLNSGWVIGNWFEAPKLITILVRLVVLIAIIRGVVLLMQLLHHK